MPAALRLETNLPSYTPSADFLAEAKRALAERRRVSLTAAYNKPRQARHLLAAFRFHMDGNKEKAVTEYRKAIKIDGVDNSVYGYLTSCLSELRRFEELNELASSRQVSQLHDPDISNLHAQALAALGKKKKAINLATAAIKRLEPDDEDLSGLVITLNLLGAHQQIIDTLGPPSEANSKFLDICSIYLISLVGVGGLQDVTHRQSIIELSCSFLSREESKSHPLVDFVLYACGYARYLVGEWAEAIDNLKSIGPDSELNDAELHAILSACYFSSRDFNAAIAEADIVGALRPASGLFYLLSGYAYRQVERYAEALNAFNRVIDLVPAPAYFLERAFTHEALGDRGRAITDCQNALDRGLKSFDAFVLMGESLQLEGRWPEALQYFISAEKYVPESEKSTLQERLINGYASLGNLNKVAELFVEINKLVDQTRLHNILRNTIEIYNKFNIEPIMHTEITPSSDQAADSAPVHPGKIIEQYLIDHEWSVVYAAERLGVTRGLVHSIMRGATNVSTSMARALERNKIGGTALDWLVLQAKYDLAQPERPPTPQRRVGRIPRS